MKIGTWQIAGIGIFISLGFVTAHWITDRRRPDSNDTAMVSKQRPAPVAFVGLADALTASTNQRIGTTAEKQVFEFPFLGKVTARMAKEQLIDATGTADMLSFRVYLDEAGHFLHAEYSQEGTEDLEWPVEKIQRVLSSTNERVIGFPEEPASISWSDIVQKLSEDVPLGEVKRMNVTYVDYEKNDRLIGPVFIVNVFGYDAMPPRSYSGEGNPKWDRTRFLFDAKGSLLLMDSNL
jgi:hypothetical protein